MEKEQQNKITIELWHLKSERYTKGEITPPPPPLR